MQNSKFSKQQVVLGREDGLAMMTVLMLLIILTVIGIAAITTTSTDIKMAGGERIRESTEQAAESCMSTGVQLIKQTIANGAIPATWLPAVSANPCIGSYNPTTQACAAKALGTAPGQNPLQDEIMHRSDGNPDSADPSTYAAPATAVCPTCNAVMRVSTYAVNMDIDLLFQRPLAGFLQDMDSGPGGYEWVYRIDCYANSFVGGTAQAVGHVSGVYSCVFLTQSDTSCKPKII